MKAYRHDCLYYFELKSWVNDATDYVGVIHWALEKASRTYECNFISLFNEIEEAANAQLSRFRVYNPYSLNVHTQDIADVAHSAVSALTSRFIERMWAYNRAFDVFSLQYDPIANVDGEEKEIYSGNDSHTDIGNDTVGALKKEGFDFIGQRKDTGKSKDSNSTDTNSVSPADEQSAFYPKDKVEHTVGNDATYENTQGAQDNEHQESVSEQNNTSNLKHTGSNEYEKTLIRHGNIGVTKTQDMINDELALMNNAEWFKLIINDVKQLICCPEIDFFY